SAAIATWTHEPHRAPHPVARPRRHAPDPGDGRRGVPVGGHSEVRRSSSARCRSLREDRPSLSRGVGAVRGWRRDRLRGALARRASDAPRRGAPHHRHARCDRVVQDPHPARTWVLGLQPQVAVVLRLLQHGARSPHGLRDAPRLAVPPHRGLGAVGAGSASRAQARPMKAFVATKRDASARPRLERMVGVPGAVLMGLGSILGTGIFVSIGIAAGVAGSSVILAVAVAAAVATFNGLSSAQLAASHPVSGGTYEYGYRYLSPALGFTAGWMFLCAKSASAATAALGFAG